jgi:hypothetical protein
MGHNFTNLLFNFVAIYVVCSHVSNLSSWRKEVNSEDHQLFLYKKGNKSTRIPLCSLGHVQWDDASPVAEFYLVEEERLIEENVIFS